MKIINIVIAINEKLYFKIYNNIYDNLDDNYNNDDFNYNDVGIVHDIGLMMMMMTMMNLSQSRS